MKKSAVSKIIAQESNVSASEALDSLQEVLNPFFPPYELGANGLCYFAPEDVKEFDKLFDRFGLEFSSEDDKFEDPDYLIPLWRRLIISFGCYVGIYASMPKVYISQINKCSPEFRQYLEAVIANDRQLSRKLAKSLDVENLDADLPKDAFA